MEYDKSKGYEYNTEYEIEIDLGGAYRGRSAAGIIFTLPNDQPAYFSCSGVKDLLNGVSTGKVEVMGEGKFKGKFIMKKRGANARWGVV